MGKPLPPAVAFRVESLVRRKADIPPESTLTITDLGPSDVLPGYRRIAVVITNEGRTSHPVEFLLSADNKTLDQVNSYNIGVDPRMVVSDVGRPARGGPETAPVIIVGFDDLECPYCARLHASIFPLITQHYGNLVHIVYRDYPLDMHPWAMHAAVDVNCLADQSPAAYWSAVDYIHAHASDYGADPKDAKAEKTMERAAEQLDAATRAQAVEAKLDMTKLNACIAKQDTAPIEASKKIGEGFAVQSTPVLFINGDKIDGAVPPEFVFAAIDRALVAQGVTPPPPYVPPTPPAPPAATPPVPARK